MSKGLNRDTSDKFYTNDDIVKECVNNIKTNIKINKSDIIIEPSAGNGAFVEDLLKLSRYCYFYDILPENSAITQCDYLKFDIENINIKPNKNPLKPHKIHVIGNPPFGRQSSLAIKFIKKSCEFCDTLSFILPKSFKKPSLQKHIPLNYHLVFEKDLPKFSFSIVGENNGNNDDDIKRIKHDVPCVFQIWEKKSEPRTQEVKQESKHFVFVKKDENPDISFRRVGGTTGTVDMNYENKNVQSHNFIKINENIKNKHSLKYIIELLNNIKYDFNNTVGPKSLSKQEIIKNVDNVLYKLQ